jgi:hypothetical protein
MLALWMRKSQAMRINKQDDILCGFDRLATGSIVRRLSTSSRTVCRGSRAPSLSRGENKPAGYVYGHGLQNNNAEFFVTIRTLSD